MLSVPSIFLRPREQAKRADEAKSKFTHADGGCPSIVCWAHHRLYSCIFLSRLQALSSFLVYLQALTVYAVLVR